MAESARTAKALIPLRFRNTIRTVWTRRVHAAGTTIQSITDASTAFGVPFRKNARRGLD